MNSNKERILPILNEAEEIYHRINDTPHGQAYVDADVILSHCIENADAESGLFEDICMIYRKCSDCDSFEALFETLTGCDFEEYLKNTINNSMLLGPDTDAESREILPSGDCNEKILKLLPTWCVPGQVVWVVGEIASVIQNDSNDTMRLVCPAIIQKVVLAKNESGYPEFYVNANVYPNCQDTNTLKDKFHFYMENIPLEECYISKDSAYESLDDEFERNDDEAGANVNVITSFTGDYAFLSNAYPCKITLNGVTFQCAEAAYQAQKNPALIPAFVTLNAEQAKLVGRSIPIRDSDWDNQRANIMYKIVMEKFLQSPELTEKLLDTGNTMIIPKNNYGETFWGVYNGKGNNYMGKILMSVRQALQV